MRVGIGRPPGRQDPADFVLKDFSSTERKELDLLLVEAADAAELLLARGLEAAQNERPPPHLSDRRLTRPSHGSPAHMGERARHVPESGERVTQLLTVRLLRRRHWMPVGMDCGS